MKKSAQLLFMVLLAGGLAGCPEIGNDERESLTPTPTPTNGNTTSANNTVIDPTMDTGMMMTGADMAMVTPDMGTPTEDMGEDVGEDMAPPATTWVEVAAMLDMKCGGCHATRFDGTADQIRMNIEGQTASNGTPFITPNNLAQSEIYLRVTSGVQATRMPRNAAQVDQVLAAALDSWISNGAIF